MTKSIRLLPFALCLGLTGSPSHAAMTLARNGQAACPIVVDPEAAEPERTAAPFIRQYLDHLHAASQGHNLTCFARTGGPHFQFKPLAHAETLWDQAEAAAQTPETIERIRLARLPLRYVWLARWDDLREEAATAGLAWPLPEARAAVADAWLALARGRPDAPWTTVTLLNEAGLTPTQWLAR
jgi:hypothetical protein